MYTIFILEALPLIKSPMCLQFQNFWTVTKDSAELHIGCYNGNKKEGKCTILLIKMTSLKK